MRITIEAMGISYPGGGRSATLGMINALLSIDKENQYDIWLDTPEPELSKWEERHKQWIIPVRNRFLSRVMLQVALPIATRRNKADVVHFTKNLSTIGVTGQPVITVYDLGNITRPQLFNTLDNWYWRHVEPFALRRACHILALSEQTALDLRTHYHLNDKAVSVVYTSCSPLFKPYPKEKIKPILDRYNLQDHYLLHVGALSPKKNLRVLIEAFRIIKGLGYSGRLVLVGPRYVKQRDDHIEEFVAQLGLSESVQLTGAVPETHLPALYNGAELFVFPSHYEGFGIAAVEAMACGVPVIVSSSGALPEVVADAGLLLHDSHNSVELADTIWRVLNDKGLATSMIQKGIQRSAFFSWERIATQILSIYRLVCNQSPS